MTLSIVTPCYNPPPKWYEGYLAQVRLIEQKLAPHNVEFIIVNDGSKVDFAETFLPIIAHPSIKLVSYEQNRGKGYAIREGVKAASGRYIIYTDIDFPFGLKPIYKIFDLLQKENDVVIGSRTKDYFLKLPFFRKVISFVLKSINHIWLPAKLADTQAGIKGFKAPLKETLLSTKTNSFVFEIEFLRKVVQSKEVKYDNVAVVPNEDIKFSDFSWRQIWKEIKSLRKILFATPQKTLQAPDESRHGIEVEEIKLSH